MVVLHNPSLWVEHSLINPDLFYILIILHLGTVGSGEMR